MGVYLAFPMKGKKSSSGENNLLTFATSETQGWRNSMEDTHIAQINLPNNIQVFGVFDGHGGSEVSLFCEKHFLEELTKNKNFINFNFEPALKETFLQMDVLLQSESGQREIKELALNPNDQFQAGCTAIVTLIHNGYIYVANAGDSRTIICDNNKFKELSFDHKPINKGEKQRIEKAGGSIVEDRVNGMLNLSRAIGDLEFKKDQKLRVDEQLIIANPDVIKHQIMPTNSYILMGCDGVWEMMDYAALEKFLSPKVNEFKNNPKELEKVLEELLEKLIAPDSVSGLGCDNMSVILISLKH